MYIKDCGSVERSVTVLQEDQDYETPKTLYI